MTTKFDVGDRVRVTFEGRVTYSAGHNIELETDEGHEFDLWLNDLAENTVEKIVLPYKAGDLVQHIETGNKMLLIEEDVNGDFRYVDISVSNRVVYAAFPFNEWLHKYKLLSSNYGQESA